MRSIPRSGHALDTPSCALRCSDGYIHIDQLSGVLGCRRIELNSPRFVQPQNRAGFVIHHVHIAQNLLQLSFRNNACTSALIGTRQLDCNADWHLISLVVAQEIIPCVADNLADQLFGS